MSKSKLGQSQSHRRLEALEKAAVAGVGRQERKKWPAVLLSAPKETTEEGPQCQQPQSTEWEERN